MLNGMSGRPMEPTPRNSGRFAMAHAGPRLLALLLLACLLVQGTLVQSHLHFTGRADLRFASGEQVSQLSKPVTGDAATDCWLCHEAAMAGAYLLPNATIVPSAPAWTLWLFQASIAEFSLPSPPLGWLSRAPPQ